MEFKQITNKSYAKYIFTQGYMTGDRNSYNHSSEQFESSWKKWLSFFVLYDGTDPVAFCGIRDFGKYARIFDRYMVLPKYRTKGFRGNERVQEIVNPLINHIPNHIPFFSIERVNRRRATINATRSINEVLPSDKQFHLLDGMYETASNSWQHISIQAPHSINLPHRKM